jgi:hypothetical protein
MLDLSLSSTVGGSISDTSSYDLTIDRQSAHTSISSCPKDTFRSTHRTSGNMASCDGIYKPITERNYNQIF